MTPSRKKPGVAFWATVVVVVVLVAYPLSIGPVQWAIWHVPCPAIATGLAIYAHFIYAPVAWACRHSESLSCWVDKYMGLWGCDLRHAPGVNLPPI